MAYVDQTKAYEAGKESAAQIKPGVKDYLKDNKNRILDLANAT